jgi:hypothetical protein
MANLGENGLSQRGPGGASTKARSPRKIAHSQ